MVKVYGPMMSLAASGTLAKTATFSNWKGRAYVRQRVIPANPKSGSQVGVRAMFKFLAKIWDGLTDADKATWEARAKARSISPFNDFMGFNQRRWRDFNTPSKQHPPTEVGTQPTGPTGVATPDGRSMLLAITDGVTPPDWGYCIFRSLTGTFTLSWANCLAVVAWDADGTTEYVDSPLDPDTYYYNAIGFLATGVQGADGTEFSGEIT